MGLLDNLYFGQNADFGGQGLLDFLRNTQMQQNNYQPSAGFPAPEQPATFADRFNATPNAPQPFNPSGRTFDSAMFDPSTYAPSQAQPIAVGDVMMPRIGGADLYAPRATDMSAQSRAPDPAAIPQNAQPTQGQMPVPQPERALPTFLSNQGGLGAGLRGFVNNLHTGPIGAIFGGIGSAMGMQNPEQQNMSAAFQSIYSTLRANGESEQAAKSKAMLAVLNPEAGKTILGEALTNKADWGIIEDSPITGKKYGWINKIDQTINGGSPNATPSGAGGAGPGAVLAQGVTFDANKTGDDYLNQFSPEIKAAVKDYISGNTIPTGNQRMQSISAYAKTIAQKYAADMGIPFSDALYSEKRKYRTELGSNSANSAGGQAKAFNQGISHLATLADTLEKLDNSNGLGNPWIAGNVNAVRQGTSIEQSAIADEAKSLGQTVAGEVGKLFSGSAGGGVHERELTRERFDTVKSKPQLAGALRATIETMQGGLSALEQNRDRILGPNSGVDFVGDETRKKIAQIQGVIDRLEGKASANAPTQQFKEGATATNKQTGEVRIFRNGKWISSSLGAT